MFGEGGGRINSNILHNHAVDNIFLSNAFILVYRAYIFLIRKLIQLGLVNSYFEFIFKRTRFDFRKLSFLCRYSSYINTVITTHFYTWQNNYLGIEPIGIHTINFMITLFMDFYCPKNV